MVVFSQGLLSSTIIKATIHVGCVASVKLGRPGHVPRLPDVTRHNGTVPFLNDIAVVYNRLVSGN